MDNDPEENNEVKRTLFAAEMVCRVQFLHEHGVIHGDLKPGNILIQDTGHIKIPDFGLSVVNVSEGDLVKNIVGTLGYTTPEYMPAQGKIALRRHVLRGTENEIQSNIAASMQPASKERVNQTPENSAHMTQNQSRQIQLICKTPSARLAIKSSIRSHPFFHSIDWRDVECGRSEPPFPY
ncbi:unnamed protein product [Ranitomeya imitator]|uniref:Protein kinase domain-containing protein n=1 Tax=Ranitomeya imitator TaxID=111125 RepID=A0ABN9LPE2_9NEOB|nr:unnamed protein product [Ranitomeya imitator]